jgi:type VI protein secretion system component VasF
MAEIFYLCLCAGFQGMYLGRPRQELEEVRKNVHASLKDIPRNPDEQLTPQAYGETRRDVLAPLPIVHAVRIAILLAIATLLVFVLTPVVGDYRLKELKTVLATYESTQAPK